MDHDLLVIGRHQFRSRLIVGTGKYKDVDETARAVAASGAEVGSPGTELEFAL